VWYDEGQNRDFSYGPEEFGYPEVLTNANARKAKF